MRGRSKASVCAVWACSWTLPKDDPEGQARIGAFRKGLHGLGWIEGQNLKLDYRWRATLAVLSKEATFATAASSRSGLVMLAHVLEVGLFLVISAEL